MLPLAAPVPRPPSPFPVCSYSLQMPPHARRAAEQSDQRTEDDDGGSLLASEEGGLQQIAVDQHVRAKRQSDRDRAAQQAFHRALQQERQPDEAVRRDRKSTRLNSSHVEISYAVFCLKKKKK